MASFEAFVNRRRYPPTFITSDRSLQPEGLLPPRSVAPSGLRPLRKIPYCSAPWGSGQCLSPSVTGRALTPATHHCLGGPLPHELANRPRAPLPADNSPEGKPPFELESDLDCENRVRSNRHAVLAALSLKVPKDRRYPAPRGRLPTCYSPFCRFTCRPKAAFSLDLHV